MQPKYSFSDKTRKRPSRERKTDDQPQQGHNRAPKSRDPQQSTAFQYWKPKLEVETTTLWEYPSQHYGEEMQGDQNYVGATPSYIIWNLLQRYTKEGDTVVDPMCGSGTTLDVCRDLKRNGIGFDLAPSRPEIKATDARNLPLKNSSADFVFIDPPYSTHVRYSGLPECIGELSAAGMEYYAAMHKVIGEVHRILKPGGHMGLYVSDSFKKGRPFMPIGFELFAIMRNFFEAVDIVCVTRHNRTMKRFNWHKAAIEGNYFLRGFNYLFIMKKPQTAALTSTASAVFAGEANKQPNNSERQGLRSPQAGKAGQNAHQNRPKKKKRRFRL